MVEILAVRFRGSLWIFSLIALGLSVMPTVANANESSVQTRYGPVIAHQGAAAGVDYSDIRFKGKSVARVEGDASLHKLALPHTSDFVLVDASTPGLHCRHEFALLELSADNVRGSRKFGECMTLFGARILNGKPVIQLAAAVSLQDARFVHEFMFADGRVEEHVPVLTYCEATDLSATTTEGSKRVVRSVSGAGRAYFYSAPDDQCATTTFIVPGDSVTVRREHAEYAAIEYRNSRTGQTFNGWVKLDRLGNSVTR